MNLSLVENNQWTSIFSNLDEPLRSRVIQTVRLAQSELKKNGIRYDALFVAGGWKQQEMTINQQKVMGDIDLVLVGNWLPIQWGQIARVQSAINKNLDTDVHFQAILPRFIRKSHTYQAYRFKNDCQVIEGDALILTRLCKDNRFPKTEAVRKLFQNLVVQIKRFKNRKYSEQEEPYQIAKGYLGIGEAILMFTNQMSASYSSRKDTIANISGLDWLDENLKNKIKFGYQVKLDYSSLNENRDLFKSSSQLENIMWQVAMNMISEIIGRELEPNELLTEYRNKFRVQPIINLIFCYRMLRYGFGPNWLQAIFQLRVADLYIWIYLSDHEPNLLKQEVGRYFRISRDITENDMVSIFEMWPTLATIELV